jgi:hypothetical protein
MGMKNPKLNVCKWCHKTLNTSHPDNELCDECAKYPNIEEMRKATKK